MLTAGDIGMRSRNGGQQSPGVLVLRVGEDLVAVALLYDGSPVHHRYPVGQVFDHGKIVRHKQIRQTELRLQVQQQVDDARLNRHVERRHRLVERKNLRLQRQRPRYTDPLLLPTGELGGIAAGVGAVQPDDRQQLGDPLVAPALVEAVGGQRFSDDVETGRRGSRDATGS